MFFRVVDLDGPILWPYFAVCIVATPFFVYLKSLDTVIRQQRVRESGIRDGHPSEVPHLDLEALEAATEEMKALGFVAVADRVTLSEQRLNVPKRDAPIASPFAENEVPPSAVKVAGFGRVFVHEKERCLGNIISVAVTPINGGRVKTSFARSIASFADAPDGGEIWSYGTSDLQNQGRQGAISSLYRRSRAIGSRLPNAPLSDLWRIHLRRRAEVAEVAGLQWRPVTVREQHESEARTLKSIRACFTQMTPLKMAWLLWRYKRQKNKIEWLGELRGKLPPLSP